MQLTPKQKKAIIIATAVLVTGYMIYRTVGPKNSDLPGGVDPTGNSGGNSNPNFNALTVAQNLYEEMKGMGSDEEAIMNLLAPLTSAQFQAVYTKFGTPPYNKLSGNILIPIWSSSKDYEQPLKVWLKTELSSSQYNTIRLKFQSTNLL